MEYTNSASWLRVFIVCSLALSPAFLFTIVIELLPLRPPNEGWEANWIYWVRVSLSTVVISLGAAIQLSILVPAAGLTSRHAIFIGVSGSCGSILHQLVLAKMWIFPIPFALVFATPGWLGSTYFSVLLSIGARKWRANPVIAKQLKATIPLWLIQSFLVVIYPAYDAIFLRLRGFAQVTFILLLPAIKYFMTSLVRRFSIGIPAGNSIGMVSVKLFDALFVLKCMGSASSLVSGAVLIALDLAQNLYHFWSLHWHVLKIKLELATRDVSNDHAVIQNCVARVVSRSHSTLHLRSTNTSVLSRSTIVPRVSNRIGPSALVIPSVSSNFKDTISLAQLDEQVRFLLLESERLALVEYIECAVPVFYVSYLFTLCHLPNAKYYPDLAAYDATRLAWTVGSIAAYAVLEFASLLYVHYFLKWNINVSALHMVASVLERDYAVLQSVFMTWVVFVLQMTLQHGGTSCSHMHLMDKLTLFLI